MTLQLCLMDGDNVLFALPLPPGANYPAPAPLAEQDLDRLSSLYSLGSNRKRLGVMAELSKGGELRFSDVLRLVTNPKLAQDSLLPLVREGLVIHEGKGAGYQASEKGRRLMLILTVGLGRILPLIESTSGGSRR